jgi:uncharacterized membrane protein YdjX (TVP38/TMEM64 family)
MRPLFRWSLIVFVVLLAPIVPFVAFGGAAERWVQARLDPAISPWQAAGLVVGVLATDVLLPIPSSAVSTFSGQRLGVVTGTLASWFGMTAGATAAFALARRWGRPLAERLAGKQEFARMEALADRHGARLVVLTRALPVLAEAAILVLGSAQLTWRSFLPAVALSNLGLSLVYATFGAYSRGSGAEISALIASIGLPVLAAAVAKRLWPAPADDTREGAQLHPVQPEPIKAPSP